MMPQNLKAVLTGGRTNHSAAGVTYLFSFQFMSVFLSFEGASFLHFTFTFSRKGTFFFL